ncbi:hypothetical protein ABFS82_11G050100 [Erythranthe guttata]
MSAAAGTTTTSDEILHHTSAFLSEILSQPDLRRRLSTTFLQRLPTNLVKPLSFASQTLETAISAAAATSPSVRSSSLRLAEKILLSDNINNPDSNPFSSFLLSLVHHLRRRPVDAAVSLLDIFRSDPSFSRQEIAPFLFQELFLVHFSPITERYNEQRSEILSSSSIPNSGYDSDHDYDESITPSTTTLLSKMSGAQASSLKGLEREYEVLMEENCRIFVDYFKDVLLRNNDDQMIAPPTIILRAGAGDDNNKLVYSDDVAIKINGHEFRSTNRRYNPIWAEEGDKPSIELKKTSSKQSKKTTLSSNNPTDCSSSDSESADNKQKEKIKKPTLFESRQQQQQNPPLLPSQESIRSFMEEPEINISGGAAAAAAAKTPSPKDFVCPITTHIFDDPVTLETGQTYERRAIQEWLDRGNATCPITRQKLHSIHLPKTNYVLKRLIASWLDRNPGCSPPTPIGQSKRAVSPNSVISQAAVDGAVTELKLAITDLCTSEILKEAEIAVLKIERLWKESNVGPEIMQALLSKPPVVNGFVEMLFNSVDKLVLRATVLVLTELASRDDSVVQTLTRVDSDVECVVELFKKGLTEAVVLVHLLKPSAKILLEMELVDYLLATVTKTEDNGVAKMCVGPKTASLVLLGNILRGCDEEARVSEIVRSVVSSGAIEGVVVSLKGGDVTERVAAVGVLLRCILEDGKCRNVIAEKSELGFLLEMFVGVNDVQKFEIVRFLFELVKLNRRSLNDQILHVLRDEGTFSTMHTLLVYQQNSVFERSPIVAGLLLQLDLLEEPRKMSIYREEAIDTLISCLRNTESPSAQITAAETILSLQGRFSYSGKSLSRAILLKRAGLDKNYKAFMRKDQRRRSISLESQDNMEDERNAEEWERKVAFVLVSHEFGLVFEALAEGLKSKYEELQSLCFMTATWLVYMLSILPDTGIRGAARVCLLKHFISIFKSDKDTENRALAMLALNSFTRDPEGFQDLGGHMKDIMKGLRELKKSSTMAFEMLKVFSAEHDNSADIWNHQELSQEDCSSNGEVLTVTCFKGKIFSGHSDGTIKVWKSENSELNLIQEIHEHTKHVTSLAVVHSSEKLYSGSLDKTVRVWAITEEGIYCEQVQETKDQINTLVVANSIACYIPQGAGVKVHSWNGSSKVLNQHKYAKCLALVQGKLYCGCNDNSIQEIDLATGTLGNIQSGSKKLIGKVYPIYALQVYDGLIYGAGPSFDGSNVKIWSTSNYSIVGSLASTLDIRTMSVSSELIYLGCKSGVIEIWCKKKLSRVETLQIIPTSRILCMAIDTNEDFLVVGTSDGRIQTWGFS